MPCFSCSIAVLGGVVARADRRLQLAARRESHDLRDCRRVLSLLLLVYLTVSLLKPEWFS